jgi:hypothetical protein
VITAGSGNDSAVSGKVRPALYRGANEGCRAVGAEAIDFGMTAGGVGR